MHEVQLAGCRPDPLAAYLKAVGILRLVATQEDPEALGWWRDDAFVLRSKLSADELVRFLEERYRPTPVLAPWNKDSGFYRAGTVVDAVETSTDDRLEPFRRAICVARAVLAEFGWRDAPGKDAEKAEFVATLRSRLPDDAARWLDVVAAIGDGVTWAPLFVAGGVDGRFEFTRVFAEAILLALGLPTTGQRRGAASGRSHGDGARSQARSRPGLRVALFGAPEPRASVPSTAGLLLPGSVEAPNAAQGFVGRKRLNPWDYVLAVEGALLLAGAVSRRLGPAAGTRACFPFSVEPAVAGYASVGAEQSRGELWLPIWDRPMTAAELGQLFREGRAEWRGRPARTATDMARAIVSLGVDRGLREFRRFGVQRRSGRSHLAVALGRWPVTVRPEAELLESLDVFLGELRSQAGARDAPATLVRALRRLESAIFAYARLGGRSRLLDVLLAAASAELAIARRPGIRKGGIPHPLSGLPARWVEACDDGSVEFELAAALASLSPAERGPGTLREHLEPVVRTGLTWSWATEAQHQVVWTGRDALQGFGSVLVRRIVDAQREGVDPPLDGRARADPRAVAALVEGEVNLDRLGRLTEALALVDWSAEPVRLASRQRPDDSAVPAAYAILKLVFLGRPLRQGELKANIRADGAILALLRSGDVWGATVRAARRLRAAGLTVKGLPRDERRPPIPRDPPLGHRLLAALAVPVQEGPLVRAVLERGIEPED